MILLSDRTDRGFRREARYSVDAPTHDPWRKKLIFLGVTERRVEIPHLGFCGRGRAYDGRYGKRRLCVRLEP